MPNYSYRVEFGFGSTASFTFTLKHPITERNKLTLKTYLALSGYPVSHLTIGQINATITDTWFGNTDSVKQNIKALYNLINTAKFARHNTWAFRVDL